MSLTRGPPLTGSTHEHTRASHPQFTGLRAYTTKVCTGTGDCGPSPDTNCRPKTRRVGPTGRTPGESPATLQKLAQEVRDFPLTFILVQLSPTTNVGLIPIIWRSRGSHRWKRGSSSWRLHCKVSDVRTNTNTIALINYQSLDVGNHLILCLLQIMDIFVNFKVENAASMENITV